MQILRMKDKIEREDITLSDVAGFYNQQLFDLNAEDGLISLMQYGSYNSAIDLIGVSTTDLYRIERNFITYIAPRGSADGSPVSYAHADACAPGNKAEWGTVAHRLEGFGRQRGSTDSRDATSDFVKFSSQTPRYYVDGSEIRSDWEWDMATLSTAMLQDWQDKLITGDRTVAGEHDGLTNIVKYGYTDPYGVLQPMMDSLVFDYNHNVMSPANPVNDVTYQGNALTGVVDIYQVIKEGLKRIRYERINKSSLPKQGILHLGLLPAEHLYSLLETYVCHTQCSGEQAMMYQADVQATLNALKAKVGEDGSVVLNFDGIPVLFKIYDYGLLTETGGNAGDGDIYILTPRAGNMKLLDIQLKDMNKLRDHPIMRTGEYNITDNGRWLSWTQFDHTCWYNNLEMQWRIYAPAPWAQMVIRNVKPDSLLGATSGNPNSNFFFGSLDASPTALSSTFTQYSNVVAVNDMYSTPINTQLTVNAASGVLANDTGTPAPAATAVTDAATTEGGTITISADGSFVYTPPTATFTGVDTYVYTATNTVNGSVQSDTATITIVVYDTNA